MLEEVHRMASAKVFWSGRSQAVRLPKDFRFDTEQVRIRRHGNAVILEPIAEDWAWLEAVRGPVEAAFEEAVRQEPVAHERRALDVLK
jgi:antitoxin VapB